MNRGRAGTRAGVGKRAGLSVLLLLAIVIQPLNMRSAGASCPPAGHNCCQHQQVRMGSMCPVSSLACSVICSTNQSTSYLVNPRESMDRAELQLSHLSLTILPALPMNRAHSVRPDLSPPVLPPIAPLSQTCLLLI
jgi:hypothetical protein